MDRIDMCVFVAMLALSSGCERVGQEMPAPVGSAAESARPSTAADIAEKPGAANEFAGLVLTGRGNEPGWSVRIEDGDVTLSHQFGTETLVARTSSVADDQKTRTIKAYDGERLVIITQTFEPCQDDATGAYFPYAVAVQVGERVLKGCGGTLGERLARGEWLVEDIDGAGVIDRSRVTMQFWDDGTLSGSGGCNNYSGTYSVSGTQVELGPLAATRRACAAEAMTLQEQKFFAALNGTLAIEFSEEGILTLRSADGKSLRAVNQ